MMITMEFGIGVGLATEADLDGILELQAANQAANGGRLSANMSRMRIVAMMGEMPLVVARSERRVVGFLMTCTLAVGLEVPIISEMLKAYPGVIDAYVYGPICVDEVVRGKGVAQAMFAELRRLLPGREGILFIRQDNEASLSAHQKMNMREVAAFMFAGVGHKVLCYMG